MSGGRHSATVLALTLAVACGEPAVPPAVRQPLPALAPDRVGPFGVGVTTRQIPAVQSELPGEPSMVEIWYPADPDGPWATAHGERLPTTGILGFAVRDVPILEGYEPFPVVVFSHGLAAIREQNQFQVQHLASHGYVVLSADHHPSLLWEAISDRSVDQVIRSAINRPREILAELDLAEAISDDPADAFHTRLRVADVVVIGHSFGGYSALSVSGAHGRYAALRDQCAADARLRETINCTAFDSYTGNIQDIRVDDARIAGVMPLTPGGTPLFRGGLDEVRVPVFMWGGGADDLVEPDLVLDWVYDDLPAPKLYAMIPGAGHLDFSQICQGHLPFGCGFDGPYDAAAMLRMINDLGTSFVDWIARKSDAGRAALEPAAVARRWRHLQYQADFGTR